MLLTALQAAGFILITNELPSL